MNSLKSAIELEIWAGKNIAFNLKYVPEEKYNWKAGADAKSIQDIVEEVVDHTVMMAGMLNAPITKVEPKSLTTVAVAQAAIEKATAEYGAFLGTLKGEDLQGEMDMGGGMKVPKEQFVTMPVIEALHHHGQIAFIQTLWGDKDTHFFQMGGS